MADEIQHREMLPHHILPTSESHHHDIHARRHSTCVGNRSPVSRTDFLIQLVLARPHEQHHILSQSDAGTSQQKSPQNLTKDPPTSRQQAYFSLVRPHLEYCCSVWNPHTNKHYIQNRGSTKASSKIHPPEISSYGQCLGHDSTSEMGEPGEEKKCCKPPPHVQDPKQHSSHQCTPLHSTHDCQEPVAYLGYSVRGASDRNKQKKAMLIFTSGERASKKKSLKVLCPFCSQLQML